MLNKKLSLPTSEEALPGRSEPLKINNVHFVNGAPLRPPFSEDQSLLETIYLGLGCFWGAERKYWQMEGVVSTAVGYMGGLTQNPTYEEVCSGLTGHNEVVMVVFNTSQTSAEKLLAAFFELHDPTQGMRQGNDIGTQYRSGIYVTNSMQLKVARKLSDQYQVALTDHGHSVMTTEIINAPEFYYAEDYHQQYLAKNPNGYCGIGGTGVTCPI